MSKKSAILQQFQINKSPLLIKLLVIIHSLAGFASLANGLILTYKLIALLTVGYSLFFYLRRYHFQFQTSRLRHNENSDWSIAMTKNGDFQDLEILPSSVVTSWLIVLHFRLENCKQHSLVIFNDALNNQDYRRLMVALKIAGLKQDDNFSA